MSHIQISAEMTPEQPEAECDANRSSHKKRYWGSTVISDPIPAYAYVSQPKTYAGQPDLDKDDATTRGAIQETRKSSSF